MDIVVIVPAEIAHDVGIDGDVRVKPYKTGQDILVALGYAFNGAVLLSDLIPPTYEAIVASAIRQANRPVVEVRTQRWDGELLSPVSAVCRGVISGFGLSGVEAAVALLRREAAS